MPTLTEGMHEGEFIGELSMGIGYHVDEKTLISGQDLGAGTVLGTITASGKFTQFDQDGANGSEAASGILFGAVDASGGDVTNARVFLRGPAIVNGNDLTWPSDIDPAEQTAAEAELLALGIKVV